MKTPAIFFATVDRLRPSRTARAARGASFAPRDFVRSLFNWSTRRAEQNDAPSF